MSAITQTSVVEPTIFVKRSSLCDVILSPGEFFWLHICSKQTTKKVVFFKFLVLFATGPFEVTFSERGCFLKDSEASFVPCDTDLDPLATQVVASVHESKTALEALSLNGDLLRYVLR